jgi:hypothetical protein
MSWLRHHNLVRKPRSPGMDCRSEMKEPIQSTHMRFARDRGLPYSWSLEDGLIKKGKEMVFWSARWSSALPTRCAGQD